MNICSLSWECSNRFYLRDGMQLCRRLLSTYENSAQRDAWQNIHRIMLLSTLGLAEYAQGKVTAGRPTWLEFVMVVPVEGDILNGMVGHPDACAGWQVQAVCQGDVMGRRDADLPDAYGRVHAQGLLHGM